MKFLLYISESYSIPIGRPLQKEIVRRGDSVKWFCDKASTKQALDADMTLLDSVEEVKAYHPDVVLVATNTVPDFFPGIKVQIFHGFSVGKRSDAKGHFNIRGFFDLYCTQGPSTTKPFKVLQQKHKHFEVVETGWSKVDPLFPLTKGTTHDRPVVMISSTFTQRLSLAHDKSAVREIERLSRSGKWHFIAVLHPKMAPEIVEHFRKMQHEHFRFYETVELIPLMKEADVMLSDTTSAITEFILQRKPVVTLRNNRPDSHLINIQNAEEMEAALHEALAPSKRVMEAIDRFIADTHPYQDGKSSKRVIDATYDFLANHTPKRKPLNLIRRYQIRKKLNYWRIG